MKKFIFLIILIVAFYLSFDSIKLVYTDVFVNNEYSVNLTVEEKQILTLINERRSQHGLQPLVQDNKLTQIAREKAYDMGYYNYFDHTSPTLGTANDMLNKNFIFFYKKGGENLAKGERRINTELIVQAWFESKDHYDNIIDPQYKKTGVGIYKDSDKTVYYVQLFIG